MCWASALMAGGNWNSGKVLDYIELLSINGDASDGSQQANLRWYVLVFPELGVSSIAVMSFLVTFLHEECTFLAMQMAQLNWLLLTVVSMSVGGSCRDVHIGNRSDLKVRQTRSLRSGRIGSAALGVGGGLPCIKGGRPRGPGFGLAPLPRCTWWAKVATNVVVRAVHMIWLLDDKKCVNNTAVNASGEG